jgi:hypothetical protein
MVNSARGQSIFLISFYDGEDELGGCVLCADDEKAALNQLRDGKFAHKVLALSGNVLVTEMHAGAAALVPERFLGRILSDDEFDELYGILRPAALVPEGPVLDAARDLMIALLKK